MSELVFCSVTPLCSVLHVFFNFCFCFFCLFFPAQRIRCLSADAGVAQALLASRLYLGVSQRVHSEYQSQAKRGNLEYRSHVPGED